MERKISKIKQLICEEMGSAKMMILSIMMSFGLVLSIMYFVVSMFSTLETIEVMRDYVKSPYDAELNGVVAMAIDASFIFQIVGFFLSFIPLALLTLGIYMLYANAKNGNDKLTGMKLTGGVLKYHGIMSFIGAALMIIIGVVLFVLVIAFSSDIMSALGDTGEDMELFLWIMAFAIAIVFGVVGLFYIGKGVVIMLVSGNMKYLSDIHKGKLIKKMSIIGAIILLIAGIDSLFSIFSSFTTVGLTSSDVEMLEEMLGGDLAHVLIDSMPSKIVQFETMAVSIAYTFFIGVSEVLAAVVLIRIRGKINKVLEEQEVVNYGGDNFISSN